MTKQALETALRQIAGLPYLSFDDHDGFLFIDFDDIKDKKAMEKLTKQVRIDVADKGILLAYDR